MKHLFIVMHHHRHGTSVGVIRASRQPTETDACRALGFDFDPDDDEEWIEVVVSEIVELE